MLKQDTPWWQADKNKVHIAVLEYAKKIENEQGDVFDRMVKMEALYDPNTPSGGGEASDPARVTENVVAANIDTIVAGIASTEIRARIMTDGGDWAQQRRARHQEWYAEEMSTRLGVHQRCRSAFKECAKKGNGITKVSTVFGKVEVNHVLVENVVVPQAECRNGKAPRQMHIWDAVDVEELEARFPKKAGQIRAAFTSRRRFRAMGRYVSLVDYDVEVLESIRLPIGVKGQPGYKPGRRTMVIDGCDLLDEPWEKDHFGVATIVWSERATSWYGISGAERIAGIQRALNRRNWQIEVSLDRQAMPTTYVRPADAGLIVKSNRVGAMAVCKGEYPKTIDAQAVSGETYKSRLDLRDSAAEEFGQSRMTTHAAKPAGLDSAVAIREYHDKTTMRFALQEEDFERLVLDTIWLVMDACRDLGAKAPTIQRHTRFGKRRLSWKDVDLRDLRVQMKAASNLNRTPAGRQQFVIELAQAGIISQDSARRLLTHPDIESELSLYTAALESVEHALDEIADGSVVMPEPFMNLAMCVWRGQNEYLKWQVDGAPEEILESLRGFVVQAAYILLTKQAANANSAMGAPMGAPGEMPALPAEAPMGAPTAAFAPQAMQLRAS